MGWGELIDSLDGLETEREYDGYFCSVKDAVIILVLGSLCDLRNIKRIHEWAETEHIREYLKTNFNIQRVPCYWWLLSLLAIVTPESLNRCMMTWVS
ncbi:MAG: ISAs1 family transposase, partial [Treponema sp.]|nr:ISAs1 family transposase [Treponema sp.]